MRRTLYLSLLFGLLLLVLVVPPAKAQHFNELSDTLTNAGAFYDVAMKGNVAYATTYTYYSLQYFSVDPTTGVFTPLGSIPGLDAHPRALHVLGDLLLLAAYDTFYIYNITVPETPTLISALDLDHSGVVDDLAIEESDSLAFLARSYGGLLTVDFSDPSQPAEIHYTGDYVAKSAAVDDTLLHVGVNGDSVYTFNVADPAAPVLYGGYKFSSYSIYDMETRDGTLAISLASSIELVDYTDPTSPTQLTTATNSLGGTSSWHMDWVGDTLFVANRGNGVFSLDLSNPSSPTTLASHSSNYEPNQVSWVNGHLLALSQNVGIQLYQADDLLLLGEHLDADGHYDCDLQGDTLVMVGHNHGFSIHQVQADGSLLTRAEEFVGHAGTPENGLLIGDYLYIHSWFSGADSLLVYDITDWTSPVQVASAALADGGGTFDLKGDTLVVGANTYYFFDVSNPASPTQIASFAAGSQTHDLHFHGDYLFAGHQSGDGFAVYDVSNLSAVSLVNNFAAGSYFNVYAIAVEGDKAYASGYSGGGLLVVLDISDPANQLPELGRLDHAALSAEAKLTLQVEDDYLIAGNRALQLFDVHDPTNPIAMENLSLTNPNYQPLSMVRHQDNLYLASEQVLRRVHIEPTSPRAASLLAPADSSHFDTLSVELSWTPSADLNAGEAVTYDVLTCEVAQGAPLGPLNQVQATGLTDTSFIFQNLTNHRTYGWAVRSVAADGSALSDTFSFTVYDSSIVFQQLTPEDGAIVDQDTLIVNWTAATGIYSGGRYDLDWSVNADFAGATQLSTYDTFAVLQGLPQLDTLYWRVEATDGSGNYIWAGNSSEGFSFLVDEPDAPAPFTLLSPADGDTCWTLDTTLVWQSALDTDLGAQPFYDLWMGQLPDLSDATLIADSSADTTFALTGLLDDHSYYWTVRATDSNTSGTWAGDTLAFHSYLPEAPAAFAFAAPDSGATVHEDTVTVHWHPAADPDPGDAVHYLVEWSTDPGFATAYSGTTGDTLFTITDLADALRDLGNGFTAAGRGGIPSGGSTRGGRSAVGSVPTGSGAIINALPDDNTLHWRVTALDGYGNPTPGQQGNSWTFDVDVQEAPEDFSLLAPARDDTVWTTDTTLVWRSAEDPDPYDVPHYDLWVDTLADLSTAWLAADSSADTTFALTGLLDDHSYYWTVRVTDSNTPGQWAGDTLVFHTYQVQAPTPFLLLAPDSTVTLVTDTVDFRWQASSDPDPGDVLTYTLRWNDGSGWVDTTTGDTTLRITGLADDQTFHWSVRVTDAYDSSATSNSYETGWPFSTYYPDPPQPFSLLSPEDQSEVPSGALFPMTFDWAAATDPDPDDTLTYTLELSMDSLFADPVTVDAGEADSVQVAALEQATWYWRVAAQDRHGLQAYSSETWTLLVTLGVAEGRFSGLPEEFALASLYPNPFNPTLTVVVALPQAAEVNVQVYDTMGRRVAELARGRREAGFHSLTFDGSRIASGAYFVRAVVPGELNTTRKVVLMK